MEDTFLECRYSQQETPFDLHFHNAYEVVYVCAGTARFFIGESCYTAAPGSILFISKLEEHSVEIVKTPYRRYYLQLTSAQLDQSVSDIRLRSVFMSRPPGFSHCFSLGDQAPEAKELFCQMEAESRAPDAFHSQKLSALFRLLLILCYRTSPRHFPAAGETVPESVLRVQAYLDQHFASPLKLSELARDFFVSPSYLSHSFRRWLGCSPKQYLMLCRLSHAKRLLATTEKSVSETAEASGFEDVSNFIRSFRLETGVTPMEYRRRNGLLFRTKTDP